MKSVLPVLAFSLFLSLTTAEIPVLTDTTSNCTAGGTGTFSTSDTRRYASIFCRTLILDAASSPNNTLNAATNDANAGAQSVVLSFEPANVTEACAVCTDSFDTLLTECSTGGSKQSRQRITGNGTIDAGCGVYSFQVVEPLPSSTATEDASTPSATSEISTSGSIGHREKMYRCGSVLAGIAGLFSLL